MRYRMRSIPALLVLLLVAGLVPASAQSINGRIVATGAAPAATTCGTLPVVAGNDNAGTITIGTGTPGACTLTFNVAFANVPTCYFNDQTTVGVTSGATTYKVVETASAVTVTFQINTVNGDVITYLCIGR